MIWHHRFSLAIVLVEILGYASWYVWLWGRPRVDLGTNMSSEVVLRAYIEAYMGLQSPARAEREYILDRYPFVLDTQQGT